MTKPVKSRLWLWACVHASRKRRGQGQLPIATLFAGANIFSRPLKSLKLQEKGGPR